MLPLLLLLTSITPAFGQARFHRGDDLRWADPAFDDSSWELVADGRFPRLEDFKTNRLWIRTRVVIPAGEQAGMVIRFCACEFYLNGKRVGATGDWSTPRPKPGPLVQSLLLPADTPPGPALLAMRHYFPPGNELAAQTWRFSVPPVVVPVSSLTTAYADTQSKLIGGRIAGLLALILVAVLSALGGQRMDALAFVLCSYLASAALNVYLNSMGGADWFVAGLWSRLAVIPQPPLLLASAALLAGVRVRAWWLGSFLCAWLLVRLLWLWDSLNAAPSWWAPLMVLGYFSVAALAVGITAVFVSMGWRRPGSPRLLLLMPLIIQLLSFAGRGTVPFGPLAAGIPIGGLIVIWDQIAKLLFGVMAGAFVVRRSRERRAEEQRMRSELQAARTVQSMLLGQAMPAGVDAVYVPANEVGGDFYYSVQRPQGRLVLVGDVSGKGLQAAMTVSAILVVMRTIKAWHPDEVLAALNTAMLGNAGFVTCCCVLVRSGDVLVANAGHPAPYFDGVECEAPGGLPLGVSVDASWEVSTHARPSVITLISDGVVEATNTAGQLFGFERTLSISRKPAKEIAQTAQAWGQEDDITVVTVH